MTYRDLLECLQKLTEEQLECTLTVELGISDECLPAEWRICGEEHFVLDDGHPVIYVSDF